MSQAEELLTTLSEAVPEHKHPLVDSDNYFIIDPVTRIIASPTGRPLTIMQLDHNSTVYTFKLPRYIDGHDMSLCNRVKCHFNNIESNAETGETIEHPDVTELTDLRVNPDDENSVICSWVVTRQATWYPGALGFFLQYLCIDDEGNETYEWHTDNFTDVIVNPTKHNDEAAIIEYTAIFEQWRERIFGAGDSVKNELISLTEEKLSAIDAEGAAQVETIANEGLRVLNTIPEDYSAMGNSVDILTRVAGPVIRQEVEGVSITVTDSAKMPLLGLQMFGKSEQKITTGKNLFPVTERTENGVTLTKVDDYYVLNGTATISGIFRTLIGRLESGAYALSANNPQNSGIEQPIIQVYSPSRTKWLSCYDNGNNTKITGLLDEADDYESRIRYENGITYNNYIVRPQLEVGDVITDYEPYTGGKPSPNPEYPQEIVSVENPKIMICGKNRWNHAFNTVDLSSVSGWGNSVWGSDAIQIVLKPNTKYTLSFDVTCLSIPEYETLFDDTIGFNLYSGKPGGKYIVLCSNKEGTLSVGEKRHASQTFTTPDNIDDLSINYNILRYTQRFLQSDGTPVYATVKFENIQLEEGSVATAYEEFVGNVIAAEIELPGLPVSTGGNYIDENDQRYMINYRDLGRGVDVINCKELVLTGEENWQMYHHAAYGVVNGFRLRIADMADISNIYFVTNYSLLSTHFQYGGYVCDQKTTGIGISEAQYIYLRFDSENDTISTLDDLRYMLREKYASDNPVKVLYVLKEPIETPIPEAELQAYRALRTNYPNTTLLNNSGAHMKLAYGTDTKMYIDKKFAELQAAILANS